MWWRWTFVSTQFSHFNPLMQLYQFPSYFLFIKDFLSPSLQPVRCHSDNLIALIIYGGVYEVIATAISSLDRTDTSSLNVFGLFSSFGSFSSPWWRMKMTWIKTEEVGIFLLKHNIYASFILCYLALNKIPSQSTFHFGFCFIILTERKDLKIHEKMQPHLILHTHGHRQSSHTVAYVMVKVFFKWQKNDQGALLHWSLAKPEAGNSTETLLIQLFLLQFEINLFIYLFIFPIAIWLISKKLKRSFKK